MRKIDLKEYETSKQYRLSVSERDQLRDLLPSVSMEPAKGKRRRYHLRPGSIVGALEMDGLSVLIKPKIGIPQLLSLACYAMGVYKPQEQHLFDFQKAQTLPNVLALALIAAARRAFGSGLLRGYLTEEDALQTVRGRIRFDEQIRRRYGIPLPVELRFDEFTEDILANRLVKAAAARLRHMTLEFVGCTPRAGLDRRSPRKRLAARISTAKRARGPLRPAERALPTRGRVGAVDPAAQ